MKISFVKKLAKEDLFLFLGITEQGIDCYYYVKVRHDKLDKLTGLEAGAKLNISEYGEVIEKGYGYPP